MPSSWSGRISRRRSQFVLIDCAGVGNGGSGVNVSGDVDVTIINGNYSNNGANGIRINTTGEVNILGASTNRNGLDGILLASETEN